MIFKTNSSYSYIVDIVDLTAFNFKKKSLLGKHILTKLLTGIALMGGTALGIISIGSISLNGRIENNRQLFKEAKIVKLPREVVKKKLAFICSGKAAGSIEEKHCKEWHRSNKNKYLILNGLTKPN